MSREKSSPSAQCRPILVSAFSPLFERAVFLKAEFLLFRLRVSAKRRYSLPCGFHFAIVTAPIVSETTSLTVVHWMSGNAWSYWRLVAYGFIRLSEEA